MKNVRNQLLAENQPGFIAFTAVLVVAAVLLVISTSVGLLSISQLQISFGWRQSTAATTLAFSCIEDALLRLRRSSSYTGSTLAEGTDTCTSTVTGTGADRSISVISTIVGPPDYVKEYVVTVKRTGSSVTVVSIREE